MSVERREARVWLYAFGYFAAYVPYSALTKALSSGALGEPRVSGFEMLPCATAASAVGMIATLTALGWWEHASSFEVAGRRLPRPSRWTFLSGVATSAILLTTTLAYSFTGTSIVLMMLLMRGGVLVLAPIVDALSHRRVRWFSWIALAASLAALVDAVATAKSFALGVGALVDVAVYLGGYFVRLRFMSHLAKGSVEANRRYFVEEQMVATPISLVALALFAWLGTGSVAEAFRSGFVHVPTSAAIGWVILIGLFSQMTGLTGGLVLLDPRENSFAVPVNRAASVIAGIVATALGARWLGGDSLGSGEIAGAALVVLSIAALTLGPRFRRRTPT